MKRRTIHQLKVVRVMTDPEPRFVSHVRNGANQTPFRKLAQAEDGSLIEASEGSEQLTEETPMPKTTVRQRERKAGADTSNMTPEIHKMIFPVADFPQEADVKTYLNNHGYDIDALTVKGAGEQWEVEGHPAEDFASDLQDITIDTVTLQVGILSDEAVAKHEAAAKAAEQGATTTETATTEATAEAAAKDSDAGEVVDVSTGEERAEAAAETDADMALFAEAIGFARRSLAEAGDRVQKFDTMAEVLGYYDGVPPGFYDLMNIFDMVVRSALSSSDYGSVRRAARDLGEYMIALATVFEAAADGKSDEAAKAMAAKAAHLYLAARQPGKAEGMEEVTETTAEETEVETTETKTTAEEAVETETVAEAEPAAAGKAAEVVDPLAALKNVLTEALAPVVQRLDGLDKRVEGVETSAAQKNAGEAAAVVQPSRKGADEGPSAGNGAEKEKSFKYIDHVPDDLLIRGLFGLQ